jgi:hypothetical protein
VKIESRLLKAFWLERGLVDRSNPGDFWQSWQSWQFLAIDSLIGMKALAGL